MRVFVTVGSTQFDPLVRASLSPPVVEAVRAKGYTHLVVQCGKYSDIGGLESPTGDQSWDFAREGVRVELWRYKATLQQEFEAADLVISHAGMSTYTWKIVLLLVSDMVQVLEP